MTEKKNQEVKEKVLGEYVEEIDFEKDPCIHMFYKHMNAAVIAFTNPNQSASEAFEKYLMMLRIAEEFLGRKFDFDFSAFRKELRKKLKENGEEEGRNKQNKHKIVLEEVKKIAELLERRTRKITIVLKFKKPKVEDEKSDTSK